MKSASKEQRSNDQSSDDENWYPVPTIPNFAAIALLALSAIVAAAGMFVLPSLREVGFTFVESFVMVGVMETSAAIGVIAAVPNLYFVRNA